MGNFGILGLMWLGGLMIGIGIGASIGVDDINEKLKDNNLIYHDSKSGEIVYREIIMLPSGNLLVK